MPSKVTGPKRSARWRERVKGQGLVSLTVWVPAEVKDDIRRVAVQMGEAALEQRARGEHPSPMPLFEAGND